jgi:hypothetical protein
MLLQVAPQDIGHLPYFVPAQRRSATGHAADRAQLASNRQQPPVSA